MNIMRVAAGAWISVQGYVLMGKRLETKLRPELWELPGGKIDGRETPEEALRREWYEEIELEIQVGNLIGVASFEVECPIIVELYQVWPLSRINASNVFDGGSIRSSDHSEVRWINPDAAIERFPCSPAFYLHYPRLRDWIKNRKDLVR